MLVSGHNWLCADVAEPDLSFYSPQPYVNALSRVWILLGDSYYDTDLLVATDGQRDERRGQIMEVVSSFLYITLHITVMWGLSGVYGLPGSGYLRYPNDGAYGSYAIGPKVCDRGGEIGVIYTLFCNLCNGSL